jgi:hypothetical protein
VDVVQQIAARAVEGNAIRATVSSRAKDKESLRAKLLRFMDNPAKQALIHNVDDVFAQLGDLAAVRVSTYFAADRERVVELLKGEFVNKNGQRLGNAVEDIEVKPSAPGKPTGKSSPNYRATHCMAYIPEAALKGAGDIGSNIQTRLMYSRLSSRNTRKKITLMRTPYSSARYCTIRSVLLSSSDATTTSSWLVFSSSRTWLILKHSQNAWSSD